MRWASQWRPSLGAQDGEELQRAIQLKVPAKIDIGPVYNVDPQRRAAFQGAPARQPGLQPVRSAGSGSECARLGVRRAGLGARLPAGGARARVRYRPDGL